MNGKISTVLRSEIKYLLDPVDHLNLARELPKILQVDSHMSSTGYWVRSLYFDSVYNTDFLQKAHGEMVRKKIRLRIYDPNDDFAKLELKAKYGNKQKKESLVISKEEAQQLISGDFGLLLERSEELAQRLYVLMTTGFYRPKVIVEYRRQAYTNPDLHIRVTLDSDIRATETDFDLFSQNLPLIPVLEGSNSVLEVKYDRFFPREVRKVISKCDSISTSVSKYCKSRILLNTYLL